MRLRRPPGITQRPVPTSPGDWQVADDLADCVKKTGECDLAALLKNTVQLQLYLDCGSVSA